MISALMNVVESRILEARENGDFDNLPGKGQPLQLDDDPLVPEEVRAAYRVLKNAGFVPPELDKVCNRHEDPAHKPVPTIAGLAAIADHACALCRQPARASAALRYHGKIITKLSKPGPPGVTD